MDKELLMPTATIVAALASKGGNDIYTRGFDIKGEFVRVYRLLQEAQSELNSVPDPKDFNL